MDSEAINNPWDLAYSLYKGKYTKEYIDDLLLCEVQELLDIYNDYQYE